MDGMTRFNVLSTKAAGNDYKIATGLAGLLLIGGCSAPAEQSATPSSSAAAPAPEGSKGVTSSKPVASPATSSSATPDGLSLGSGWPNRVWLPPANCELGTPITHQRPSKVAGRWALMVDSRCEPPLNSGRAGVYVHASFKSEVAGHVVDGQTVAVECTEPAATVGDIVNDPRDPLEYNTTWYRIRFANADSDAIATGEISGANLGQANQDPRFGAQVPDLPKC
jgi:hypothetical protein